MYATFIAFVALAADGPTPSLLKVSPGLAIWTVVSFSLVLFIIYRFAWPIIIGALDERETTLAGSLAQAEKALAEAKQIQADNQTARREAEAQAQQIMREAREAAEALRNEEVDKTREKIQQLQAQAEAEIEQMRENALGSLRAEVADLAISAAEKILSDNLDAPRQRKIVDDFLGGISSN